MSEYAKAIALDKVVPGVQPDYCVHGRTPCMVCQDWCWLGPNTFPVVEAGQAYPVCLDCMRDVVHPRSPKITKIGHADDQEHGHR